MTLNRQTKRPRSPQDSAVATVVAVVSAGVTLPFGESVIGVQLDAIAQSFDASGAILQWVVNAYMLTFATSILAMGVLGDRFDRRRMFAIGLALAASANVFAIAAPSMPILIGLRAIAGFGAGTLLATGPALLAARFPDPGKMRARAFAAFGAAAGSGIAFGPLVGGLIMGWAGWRAVFLVYLPFLLLAALLLSRIASSRDAAAAPVDGLGIVLFTTILALMVWVIQNTGAMLAQAAALTLAGALLVLLVRHERDSTHPAIEPAIFANATFRAMAFTMICWQIAVAVSMVYVPAVMVAGMAASPNLAGASILPMALMLFLATPLGPWLVSRFGVAGYVATCISLMIVGDTLIWAGLGAGRPDSIIGLVLGLALIGIGGGAANGSIDNLAMSTIAARRAGMAAGVFQTVRIGSAALAIAVAGAVLDIGGPSGHSAIAITTRYQSIAGVAAVIMTLLTVVSLCVLRRASSSATNARR